MSATKSIKSPKSLLASLLAAAYRGDQTAHNASYDLLLENGCEEVFAKQRFAYLMTNRTLLLVTDTISVLIHAGFLTKQEADEVCPWRSVAATVKAIRRALKERSGKDWSVRRDRGTASRWITISAPPRRCTKFGGMTLADRAELTALLGLTYEVYQDGFSVGPSPDCYQEAVAMVEGRYSEASEDQG